MELKDIYGSVIFALEGAKTVAELVKAAREASANLYSANLKAALIDGKAIINLRQITYSAYPYQVQAVLFENGERWVRMGCLWKSLEDWEKIGIRESNTSEFSNDGSESSEERAVAFEFAKAAALRMK